MIQTLQPPRQPADRKHRPNKNQQSHNAHLRKQIDVQIMQFDVRLIPLRPPSNQQGDKPIILTIEVVNPRPRMAALSPDSEPTPTAKTAPQHPLSRSNSQSKCPKINAENNTVPTNKRTNKAMPAKRERSHHKRTSTTREGSQPEAQPQACQKPRNSTTKAATTSIRRDGMGSSRLNRAWPPANEVSQTKRSHY